MAADTKAYQALARRAQSQTRALNGPHLKTLLELKGHRWYPRSLARRTNQPLNRVRDQLFKLRRLGLVQSAPSRTNQPLYVLTATGKALTDWLLTLPEQTD